MQASDEVVSCGVITCHRCFCTTRQNRVDANTFRRMITDQRLNQRDQSRLEGSICAHAGMPPLLKPTNELVNTIDLPPCLLIAGT